jgi:hypothetical protein
LAAVPQVWLPGAAEPLDQFVDRLHRRVEEFARREGVDQTSVEVELADGATVSVREISPDPGYGFLSLVVHVDEGGESEELIVPLGSIKRITLGRPEPAKSRFGFSLPES